MTTTLRLTGQQHALLERHLYPGDELEAVAVMLCGRLTTQAVTGLLCHEIVPIPHSASRREANRVTWSPAMLATSLERASRMGWAVVKVHSHPGGYAQFSDVDDEADRDFFASVFGWMEADSPHASAVMLPNGRLIARTVSPNGEFQRIDSVLVAGDDIRCWWADQPAQAAPDFAERHAQLFGAGTAATLKRLSAAVVGCSGTGSPVIEMLARLGVGRIVLVDPDRVEERNLNRIFNATREDAVLRRLKTEVIGAAIARMGLGTEVQLVSRDLASPEAIRAVAACDVAFGCMDSARGRSILNRLCTFYNVPYFDLGVRLDADGQGGICEAVAAVHYVQPDRSSLRDRRVYSPEQLQAESVRAGDPIEYERLVRARYIRNVTEDRPAVISINTQLAATAVNEFLARLHPYRYSRNSDFSTLRISFMEGAHFAEEDRLPVPASARFAGRGDCSPLLEMPELGNGRNTG